MAGKYQPHVWEQTPSDVEQWMDEAVSYLYGEITSDGKAVPFSAHVSDDKKLDYYRARFYNSDGTPNEQGRAEEYTRLGPEGYRDVISALTQGDRAQPFQMGDANAV